MPWKRRQSPTPPHHAAAHPTSLESSLTPQREPKNSHDEISICYHIDGRQTFLRGTDTQTLKSHFVSVHSEPHVPTSSTSRYVFSPSPQPQFFRALYHIQTVQVKHPLNSRHSKSELLPIMTRSSVETCMQLINERTNQWTRTSLHLKG
jgi:hypothetical protein